MAQHAPLTAFLAQADADVGPGTSHEFLASTGRRLVTGHIIPEEEFPRTGAPTSSDLGSLLRTLHSLGPAVDWILAPAIKSATEALLGFTSASRGRPPDGRVLPYMLTHKSVLGPKATENHYG